MSRTFRLALLTLALVSSACERERTAAPLAEKKPRFDVALLTSGSIADAGWNAAAYEGLQRIQRDLGAAAAQREALTPTDRNEQMRQSGAAGFDVVFGHGPEFGDAARSVAPAFPRTVFIVTSGAWLGPNLAPLDFRLEEATWILGMAAAFESRAARGGAVGAVRSPAVASAFDAFARGARSVRSDFETEMIYTNDPRDTEAARRAALRLIDGGADVLIHQAGEAGAGVLAACSEKRVLCLAAPRNQNDLAPDALLASAVVDVPAAMTEIATLVKERRFEPRLFSYGMKQGLVTIAWNEALRRRIAPEAMKRIDATEAAIREGRFAPGRRKADEPSMP